MPLVVLGHEAWEHWRLKNKAPWMDNLKWPQLVGTLAGDNTILVIIRSKDEVEAVMEKFRSMVK